MRIGCIVDSEGLRIIKSLLVVTKGVRALNVDVLHKEESIVVSNFGIDSSRL